MDYISGPGSGGGGGGAVSSVFGRAGAVAAQSGDYVVGQVTGAAPLVSPALTGTPTAPTQAGSDNSTRIATTAFVKGQPGPGTNGQAVLASSYDLVAGGSAGTYQDIGLSVNLPAAGTYLLIGNVRAWLTANGGGGAYLVVQLYDTVAAASVSNSERILWLTAYNDTSGAQRQNQPGQFWLVTVTGATTIKLYAGRFGSPASWFDAAIASDVAGWTTLAFVRLA
jgi:hypothetical protein